jgi:hypothetical protein
VKGFAFVGMFAAAWAKGCGFVTDAGNPYHVRVPDPGASGLGKPFALQSRANYDWCRGIIVEVTEPWGDLYGAGTPVKNCRADASRVPKSVFVLTGTGVKFEGVWTYKLLVVHRPGAEKCVDYYDNNRTLWRQKAYDVGLKDCKESKTVWVRWWHHWYESWPFVDVNGHVFSAVDITRPPATGTLHGSVEGKVRGVLDVFRNEPNGRV